MRETPNRRLPVSPTHHYDRISEPGVKVSWQVTGIRQDAYAKQHPVIVEKEKAVADRGRYLHPVELGMPESLRIGGLEQTALARPN